MFVCAPLAGDQGFFHRDGGVLGEKSRFRTLPVCTARSPPKESGMLQCRCAAHGRAALLAQVGCGESCAEPAAGLDGPSSSGHSHSSSRAFPAPSDQADSSALAGMEACAAVRAGISAAEGLGSVPDVCRSPRRSFLCAEEKGFTQGCCDPGWHRGIWHTLVWADSLGLKLVLYVDPTAGWLF